MIDHERDYPGTEDTEQIERDVLDPWPEPIPLEPPRVPAPFPVDALPEWSARYVADLAEATQTPPDLGGCCVLGVYSACAGGRAVVEARLGWREPTNLYILPVQRPGSRKSAVVSASTRAIYDVERELAQRVRDEIVETSTMREVAEKAVDQARAAAAKASPEKRDSLTANAVAAARQAAAIKVPVVPRLIADDITPEATASLLADQGGRLALISAEGGIFDVMAGRYANGVPMLDVWLKGHSGDALRVDRKARPAEYIERPALTLLLTVQPTVLAAIARNGTFRGRGLLARFLYSVPANNIGRRKIGTPAVPRNVIGTYEHHVRRLAADLAGWTDPAVLTLTPAAHDLLLAEERIIEPSLAEDGSLGPIAEWGSKLAGATVRIAGLLHLADAASVKHAINTPIPRDTLNDAIRLGTYFSEHAKAAFHLLGSTDPTDAGYLLDHLRKKGLKDFTIRSLHVELPRGRFATASEVTAAVSVLEEHGWVRRRLVEERSGPGRPPSPGFAVHPDATKSTKTTK